MRLRTFKNPVLYSLLASLLYWTLLFPSTHMVLACDALLYHKLGQLVYFHGWQEYLTRGPLQEPLFPLFISTSITWGRTLHLPYLEVQKVLQLLSLFSTQLMLAWILLRAKIKPRIAAIAVLYLGFSPAIVNSAFSLYSEIAVYPFTLGMVISAYLAWLNLSQDLRRPLIFWAAGLGTAALGATFVKGIFELITPIFLLPFVFLLLKALLRRQTATLAKLTIFFVAFGLVFYGGLWGYKSLNQRFNGNFTLTNRGPWALYGNLARRGQEMDQDRILTALAYLPGEKVCQRLRNAESCNYWSNLASDEFGFGVRAALDGSEVPGQLGDKLMIWQAVEHLYKKPFQQAAFWLMEGVKMIFWESTRVGYVTYPPWLSRFFSTSAVNYVYRFPLGVLTLFALIFTPYTLWHKRGNSRLADPQDSDGRIMMFFVLTMICAYIFIFSFFFFLIRYAFAIVPLFLTCIAFSAQNLIPRRNSELHTPFSTLTTDTFKVVMVLTQKR